MTEAVRLERGHLVWTLMDSGPTGYAATARTNCVWNVRGVVTDRSDGHGECYEVEIVGDTRHARAWYEPCELAYWDNAAGRFVEVGTELPEQGVFAKRTELCVHCGGNRNTPAHAALLTGMGHRFEGPKKAPRTAWERIGEDF